MKTIPYTIKGDGPDRIINVPPHYAQDRLKQSAKECFLDRDEDEEAYYQFIGRLQEVVNNLTPVCQIQESNNNDKGKES